MMPGIRTHLSGLSLLLAAGLLAFTFTRPSGMLPTDQYRYLFVFDISQSMNVADYNGERRLKYATQSVKTALTKLPCGSEAGLGLFVGHRVFVLFTPVEICRNYSVIASMLDTIDWTMAWEARSEIVKGLFAGLRILARREQTIRLVFLTDGHEAPPIHNQFRQRFDPEEKGEVKGLLVGVGGTQEQPIPKLDGKAAVLGYWTADEVMQIDVYSAGRQSSQQQESMVDVPPANNGRTPGREHLSALNEPHLQQLADETGLAYLHLNDAQELGDVLRTKDFALTVYRRVDFRWLLAAVALLLLLAAYRPQPVGLLFSRWSITAK